MARFYDPQIAHFVQADTIIPNPFSSHGWNRYSYVNNNPIRCNDPSGHRTTYCSPGDACGGQYQTGPGGLDDNAQKLATLAYDSTGKKQERNRQIAETVLGKGTELVLTTIAPLVGLLYQVVSDKKITAIDVAFGIIPFGLIGDFSKGLRYVDDVANTSREFESFAKFKKVIGTAGEGKQWHHIVEQIQVGKSGFPEQLINSTDNILAVDKATHSQISGYYSSIRGFTDGLRVRDWLAGQSFEDQYDFGIQVLKDFGILKQRDTRDK